MPEEWKYACVNRPPMFGAVPRNAIRHDPQDSAVPMARHGFVVYDHPLTQEECDSYELYPYRSIEEIVAYYLPLMGNDHAKHVRKYGNQELRRMMDGRFGLFAGGYTDKSQSDVIDHIANALLARYPA